MSKPIRCILVEVVVNVADVETTRYFSNVGYVTNNTDALSNIPYLPIVRGGVSFTESLDLNTRASLSFGDIELSNENGVYDSWLNDVWVNRKIQVFIGDVKWRRADFRLIFDGIVDNIDSKNRNVLNIKIRDKLQRLNTSVTEEVLGGTSINEEVLRPLTLGECFNVSPLLVDAANLEYQYHVGITETIIEVRDNGVPVSFRSGNYTGTIRLLQNPYGTITCSVQGEVDGVYENTVAKLVKSLATNYGLIDERFTDDDIDLVNFNTFDTNNQQPVGIYLDSSTNVLTAINDLADSVGAQAVMSREGKLRLLKIELPPPGTPIDLTAYNMKEANLKIDKRIPVKAAIKIGFCKNWTVQPDLQTGIPQEHKDFFSEEWISRTSSDAAVATKYKLDIDPDQKDTLLLDEPEAQAEATRLLNIYKVPRTVLSFDGFAELMELQLGDPVTLTHDRFGLDGGVTGMVIKIQIDWLKYKVKVGVLI